MQVARFVNPEWLVEIEADAVIADAEVWSGQEMESPISRRVY